MIKQLENYCELCKTITLWKRVSNAESHLEWECQNANPQFFYINKPETISRARRSLIRQAKKGEPNLQFLLNDKEILKTREELEQEEREYFSQETYQEKARLVK